MDDDFLISLAFCFLAIWIGCEILGVIAYSRVGKLRREIDSLQAKLNKLLADQRPAATSEAPSTSASTHAPKPAPAATTTLPVTSPDPTQPRPETEFPGLSPGASPPSPSQTPFGEAFRKAVDLLSDNWMAWLGGISLSLAGVFLVVYSIEQGLITPTMRTVFAYLAGLACWAGAETLRRRLIQPASVFAALAAGGSITLFAATLAGAHLYDLFSLNAAFGLLCAVALITMWLAVSHGPLLAALGIIGAYVVPILVSTGSNNIEAALGYSAVITASSLLLLNYVSRPWLWWGPVIGALGWWLLSFGVDREVHVRGWYLLGVAYLFAAIPGLDWLMRHTTALEPPTNTVKTYLKSVFTPSNAKDAWLVLVFLLLHGAAAVSIYAESRYQLAILRWIPLLAFTLFVARQREGLVVAGWFAVITTLAAWITSHLHSLDARLMLIPVDVQFSTAYFQYLTAMAVVVLGMGLWNYSNRRSPQLWAALASLTPVLVLVTGYLTTTPNPEAWALGSFLFGFAYVSVACILINSPDRRSLVIWLFFSGHLAIACAAAITFSSHALTLALAGQLVSLAWILRRFEVDVCWLIEVLTAMIILRLTANPWLISYDTTEHWSLWAYAGSTACCLVAWQMLHPRHNLAVSTAKVSAWLEGASLHLVALTLWVELRYWLHDGDIFRSEFTALEAGLNVILFGMIGISYFLRSRASTNIALLYRWFSHAALSLAGFNYLLLLMASLLGLSWVHGDISARPIFNQGLLYYAAPVVVAWGVYKFGDPNYQRLTRLVAGIGAFIFINIEIRQLWTGTFDLYAYGGISNGELLTYSATWLICAVVLLITGMRRSMVHWYPIGLGMLALVIAKIFIVDMADLTGLMRVASFLGLGLSLLGLAFLHQRFAPSITSNDTNS